MTIDHSSTGSLRPLLELQLNGETNLNTILNDLAMQRHPIDIKIIKAQLEYIGNVNFGHILLHLLGNDSENEYVIDYFNNRHISNVITGYA